MEFIPCKKKAEGGNGWGKRGIVRLPEWCSPVIFYHYWNFHRITHISFNPKKKWFFIFGTLKIIFQKNDRQCLVHPRCIRGHSTGLDGGQVREEGHWRATSAQRSSWRGVLLVHLENNSYLSQTKGHQNVLLVFLKLNKNVFWIFHGFCFYQYFLVDAI